MSERPHSEGDISERLGRCYELAAEALSAPELYERADKVRLVHGTIEGAGHPRIDHAWLMFVDTYIRAEMAEWQQFSMFTDEQLDEMATVVWDVVADFWGPEAVYAHLYNAQVQVVYTREDAWKKMVAAEHYGPWPEQEGR